MIISACLLKWYVHWCTDDRQFTNCSDSADGKRLQICNHGGEVFHGVNKLVAVYCWSVWFLDVQKEEVPARTSTASCMPEQNKMEGKNGPYLQIQMKLHTSTIDIGFVRDHTNMPVVHESFVMNNAKHSLSSCIQSGFVQTHLSALDFFNILSYLFLLSHPQQAMACSHVSHV